MRDTTIIVNISLHQFSFTKNVQYLSQLFARIAHKCAKWFLYSLFTVQCSFCLCLLRIQFAGMCRYLRKCAMHLHFLHWYVQQYGTPRVWQILRRLHIFTLVRNNHFSGASFVLHLNSEIRAMKDKQHMPFLGIRAFTICFFSLFLCFERKMESARGFIMKNESQCVHLGPSRLVLSAK